MARSKVPARVSNAECLGMSREVGLVLKEVLLHKFAAGPVHSLRQAFLMAWGDRGQLVSSRTHDSMLVGGSAERHRSTVSFL